MTDGAAMLKMFRNLGIKLGLDYDHTLIVRARSVSARSIEREVLAMDDRLVELIKDEAWQARRQYMGGPLAGLSHRQDHRGMILYHAGRGKWHGYYVDQDGRALYAGEAGSRKKIRDLVSGKFPRADHFDVSVVRMKTE